MQLELPILTALAVSVAVHAVILTNLPGFEGNHQGDIEYPLDLPITVLVSPEDEGGAAGSTSPAQTENNRESVRSATPTAINPPPSAPVKLPEVSPAQMAAKPSVPPPRDLDRATSHISEVLPSISPSRLDTEIVPKEATQRPLTGGGKSLMNSTEATFSGVSDYGPGSNSTSQAIGEGSGRGPTYRWTPLPPYPKKARQLRHQGIVTLRVHLSVRGRPEQVEIQGSSGHAELDASARETVSHWKFSPAQNAGRPVECDVEVPVRFSLDGLARSETDAGLPGPSQLSTEFQQAHTQPAKP